ncbi:MAG: M1 family metallopeptidase [Bacteroidota bacterium]
MNLVKNKFLLTLLACFAIASTAFAQPKSNHGNKFEQLGQELPTPNTYRGADGAPGPDYWQQRADYEIKCRLDDEKLRLDGSEKITYYNQAPNTLRYLWLQLDENQHSPDADNNYFDPSSMGKVVSEGQLQQMNKRELLKDYGVNILEVTDDNGNELKYTINQTMMRVELPEPLRSGDKFSFNVKWYYNIIKRVGGPDGGRGGYEYFPKDGNYIFTITQWFPRMCVYDDVEGWQNKQFTGRGEFALTFGDYVVQMDVPADYMVGSTGECLNYDDVLTPTQMQRWEKAQTSTEPVEIVTLDEAKAMEKKKNSKERKKWIYKAQNVRDFAWTASRKFIWDAMPYMTEEGKKVMCMSYYAKIAYPIYNTFSTKVVAHTLKTYSKYSIPYPYPVAISVEGNQGMEYPMISFNPGRAEEDGTYTERQKQRAIGVIIHEVGHNYFPMIINSDERQWTWMDEGINSFMDAITGMEFDEWYGNQASPEGIAGYMRSNPNYLEPIMTNSENIVNFGPNAYTKPATGLNILRETIMGRELFDYAFKEYCQRWAFKHPRPADFFRTMEDASGVDLDWFWRGWFYGIEPVDVSLDSIAYYRIDTETDPETIERSFPNKTSKPKDDISRQRNREEGIDFPTNKDPKLQDFYVKNRTWEGEDSVQMITYEYYKEKMTKEEKMAYDGMHYYELHFSNKGGLVMPIILEWTFEDGSKEIERIPVEIWRKNENEITKTFAKDKKVTAVILDPLGETADIDTSNNNWPVERAVPTRFQVFKAHKQKPSLNPMQRAQGKTIKP